MGGEEARYYAWGGAPGPDDLGLAWDAAERYAVTLLREALPEAKSLPVPVEELTAQIARLQSAARKGPSRQLARAAWGRRTGRRPGRLQGRLPGGRQRGRPAADDTDLWLDAAGAMATMRRHIGVDSPLLEPVAVLRPADWAGAVIGLVRCGVNTVVMAEDLVRYARQCPEITSPEITSPEITSTTDLSDEAVAYDPFASGVADDESLRRGFEAALLLWETIGAVSDQRWLTRLGWWGLPRALARAWNGDFDQAAWVSATGLDGTGHDGTGLDGTGLDGREGNWTGLARSPAELGIREPPMAT
jgi:hypothetical protein